MLKKDLNAAEKKLARTGLLAIELAKEFGNIAAAW